MPESTSTTALGMTRRFAMATARGSGELQRAVARMAAAMVPIDFKDIDPALHRSLGEIGSAVGAMQASIYRVAGDRQRVISVDQWTVDSTARPLAAYRELSDSSFPMFWRRLWRCEPVIIGSRGDIPHRAVMEREWFENYGFHWVLFLPGASNDRLDGALALFGSSGEERAWTETEIWWLQFAAAVLARVGERKWKESQRRHEREHLEELLAQRAEKIRSLTQQQVNGEVRITTGRIAARLAEEMTNPLAGIQTSFVLLRAAVDPEHVHHEFLDRMDHEIGRVSELIRRMIELYRPDPVTPTTFTIAEAVEDVLQLLSADLRVNGASVQIDIPNRPIVVRLVRSTLQQVLYNTLGWIIRVPGCGSRIRLIVRTAGTDLVVRLVDRGRRIPDHCSRCVSASEHPLGGEGAERDLGLSLSTARRLVDSMGGRLEFSSRLDEESVFLIRFPRIVAESEVHHE